jgi:hypothetical protein
MAGMFALDLAIAGIDKSRAVQEVFSPAILDGLGLEGKFPLMVSDWKVSFPPPTRLKSGVTDSLAMLAPIG